MAALGVNTIGSVITSQEKWKRRSISDTIAAAKLSGAKTSLIPLFVDTAVVCDVLDFYRPDIVHFCDSLTTPSGAPMPLDKFISLQKIIRTDFGHIQIMRSIPIARPGRGHVVPTLEIARKMEPVSDIFLTDTWLGNKNNTQSLDPVEGFIGITGKLCDWDLAAALVRQSDIPVILAGGISPDNVYDGILAVSPAGVDSCTLTNAVDSTGKFVRFKKDPDKVRLFVKETRRAKDRAINRR